MSNFDRTYFRSNSLAERQWVGDCLGFSWTSAESMSMSVAALPRSVPMVGCSDMLNTDANTAFSGVVYTNGKSFTNSLSCLKIKLLK